MIARRATEPCFLWCRHGQRHKSQIVSFCRGQWMSQVFCVLFLILILLLSLNSLPLPPLLKPSSFSSAPSSCRHQQAHTWKQIAVTITSQKSTAATFYILHLLGQSLGTHRTESCHKEGTSRQAEPIWHMAYGIWTYGPESWRTQILEASQQTVKLMIFESLILADWNQSANTADYWLMMQWSGKGTREASSTSPQWWSWRAMLQ